jgi:tetratricopeptide (TPR) repeat protein
MQDNHGLAITTSSQAAADAFNRTLRSYVGYRIDMSDHLGAALKADPDFALAHCARGYFMLLAYNAGMVRLAIDAHRNAVRLSAGATPREQLHVAALGAWIAGDLDKAIDLWETILVQHPTDVLAMRLAHFNYFWLGRREDMRASVERVLHKWHDGLEAYSTLLACLAFGREECGDYAAAERAGRRAVELKDGRKFSHFQPYRKGDPELPLTDEELDGKFMELAAPVLGEGDARALLAELWRTDKLEHVDYETAGQENALVAESVGVP